MFEKPEDAKMSREESEKYGQEINARSARFENVEILPEEPSLPTENTPPPLTEDEIKQRVGDQNFKNIKDPKLGNSINS